MLRARISTPGPVRYEASDLLRIARNRLFDERGASYMDFNSVLHQAGEHLLSALEASGAAGSLYYLPQRVEPRPPCAHDSVARRLRLAPPGWGATPAIASGLLEKLPTSGVFSSRRVASWHRRHFVLRGDIVAWFKQPFEGRDTDPIAWRKAEVNGKLTNYVRLSQHSYVLANLRDVNRFKVANCNSRDAARGELRLRAASPAEAQRWMSAIDTIVRAAQDVQRLSLGAPSDLGEFADTLDLASVVNYGDETNSNKSLDGRRDFSASSSSGHDRLTSETSVWVERQSSRQ